MSACQKYHTLLIPATLLTVSSGGRGSADTLFTNLVQEYNDEASPVNSEPVVTRQTGQNRECELE
jgi:flavoprotein